MSNRSDLFTQAALIFHDNRQLETQATPESDAMANSSNISISENIEVYHRETETDVIIGDEYLDEISRTDTRGARIDDSQFRELTGVEPQGYVAFFQLGFSTQNVGLQP